MAKERPISPIDGIFLKDDFLGNDSAGDATTGELLWEQVAISTLGTYAPVASPYGVLRHTTGATSGDGGVLRLDEDMVYATAGVGGISFRVKHPDVNSNTLTTNNFRIGLSSSVTATAPTDSICVESLAGVPTLRVDSADHGDVSQAAANVSTFTSGTTMVLDVWHLFEIRWTGENGQGGPKYVDLFVDNEPAASLVAVIDNDESMELSIAHWVTDALDLELDIDFIEYWHWRPSTVTASAV